MEEVVISKARRFLNFMRQLGFDPLVTARAIRELPTYIASALSFRSVDKRKSFSWSPVLSDFNANSGSATGHYFWQDLICARWIFEQSPQSHFDVGSRVDGFIAHLLSFRPVTLLDIRPLDEVIPNLTIVLGDAQKELSQFESRYDSVSSLHSIEHFGLGRYRDEIDPQGHEKGLRNIADCVKPGGYLYVSFPIGESAVEFNAQRIIDPEWPLEYLKEFELVEFVLIPWKGLPKYGVKPDEVSRQIWGQAGLYKFKKC